MHNLTKSTENSGQPKSVCLVVCYFGKLPAHFEFYLRSCIENPTIDWLILTDDAEDRQLPKNVRLLQISLTELRQRFSAKLGFDVSLDDPIRCCDFRPAFGFLLDDLLGRYDFWGHCDLDMIFGNIRSFMPSDVLESHDRTFMRGHLSVYKNTPDVNQYFTLTAPGTPSYKEVFTNHKSNQFDEWLGIYRILRYHRFPQYHRECIVDVIPPSRWWNTSFRGYHIENHSFQVFYWLQGGVFQAFRHREGGTMDRQYAYIHFQKRKLPPPNFGPYDAEGFIIGPNGFFPYSGEDFTLEDYEKYNGTRLFPLSKIVKEYRLRLARKLKISR